MHLLSVSKFMDVPFLTKCSFVSSNDKLIDLVFVLCNLFRHSACFILKCHVPIICHP